MAKTSMPPLPNVQDPSDSRLLLLYYEVADLIGPIQQQETRLLGKNNPTLADEEELARLRCQLLPLEQRAKAIEEEIYSRNFTWLYYTFRRHMLNEEPQWLVNETIYKALDTKRRKSARYDGHRPFRSWLGAIARNVRFDHAIRPPVSDTDLILKLRNAVDDKSFKGLRDEVGDRYRQILTDWFRKRCRDCGLSTRPADVKILVDETLIQLFARIAEFRPEESAFILWLSRLAKAVLAERAPKAVRKLSDVPDWLGMQEIAIESDVPGPGEAADELLAPTGLTDPRFARALGRLNPTERTVWSEVVKAEDFTPEEIARNHKLAIGTVYNALSRGRQKLKECLSQENDHASQKPGASGLRRAPR